MCEFKPGDEVVCVNDDGCPEITQGASYVVIRVVLDGEVYNRDCRRGVDWFNDSGEPVVWVGGGFPFWARPEVSAGYDTARFRKIQRRDLSAWLKTAIGNTDKLDKRHRAPAKECA